MSDCPRVGKWFGCKFRPRYELSPVSNPELAVVLTVSELDTLRMKTYVRDICVRCGKTIERQVKP